MQIFSGSKKKSSGGTSTAPVAAKDKKRAKCRALCCGGSRLSVSSDAAPEVPTPPPRRPGLSHLAHGMVQARLQAMVDERRPCACGGRRRSGGGGGRACVVLVAVGKRTQEPREEFRRSIMEVIAARRMAEPAELRGLLNCYVAVNAREHRAAILEAFHEVCSSLFSSKAGGS